MAVGIRDFHNYALYKSTFTFTSTFTTTSQSEYLHKTKFGLCPQLVKATLDVTWDLQR